jgi:peptide/nickel transport system permease protein
MQFLKRYLLPRLVQFIVVIFIGATVVFIIPRLTPNDPIERQLANLTTRGAYMDSATIGEIKQTLRELYGLEGTFLQQYGLFWQRLFHGDFGPSFSHFPTPVTTLIRASMPWTIGLMLLTTLLSSVLGSALGGLAGSFARARWARVIEIFSMTIRPIPYYIMALALVILFAYVFPVFPMLGGYSVKLKGAITLRFVLDVARHAFLPAVSLVLTGFGTWFLQMRSVTFTVVAEDYVTYAEAAGVPRWKIVSHYITRNAILPQVTGLALSLGFIFGGALITEQVFSYPGIGTLLYQAVISSDYNVIMGITVYSIVSIAVAVLAIDLVYPLLDPRVRQR